MGKGGRGMRRGLGGGGGGGCLLCCDVVFPCWHLMEAATVIRVNSYRSTARRTAARRRSFIKMRCMYGTKLRAMGGECSCFQCQRRL